MMRLKEAQGGFHTSQASCHSQNEERREMIEGLNLGRAGGNAAQYSSKLLILLVSADELSSLGRNLNHPLLASRARHRLPLPERRPSLIARQFV